jgi:hypothetical protein
MIIWRNLEPLSEERVNQKARFMQKKQPFIPKKRGSLARLMQIVCICQRPKVTAFLEIYSELIGPGAKRRVAPVLRNQHSSGARGLSRLRDSPQGGRGGDRQINTSSNQQIHPVANFC